MYQGGVPVFGNSSRVGVVVPVVPGVVVVVVLDVLVVVVLDDVLVVVVLGVVIVVDVLVGLFVVVVVAPQITFVMVLVSSVTAPFRANNWPCTVAPVRAVMDVKAKMCPTKREFVPKVAELPTFQKVRQDPAPLMVLTLLVDAVISVEAVLKMKTASGSPWASSVRVPVI